jgi:transcriptional regulator with XRE-family HTH domain
VAVRSEGSRLLGAVEMTQKQIAVRVGVSRATVAMWIRGERVPNEDHRDALRMAFRIPIEAWPDEWALVRNTIVRTLAEKAPHLLEEIVSELERAGATLK